MYGMPGVLLAVLPDVPGTLFRIALPQGKSRVQLWPLALDYAVWQSQEASQESHSKTQI